MPLLSWISNSHAPDDVGRQIVRSHTLAAIGYQPAEQRLQFEYKNGAVYEAADIAPHVASLLLDADDFDCALKSLPNFDMRFIGQVFPLA